MVISFLNMFIILQTQRFCFVHSSICVCAQMYIKEKIYIFFLIEFQFMTSAFDNCTLYYQTKTPIGFWCKWRFNLKSLIKPSETLPVELAQIHGEVVFNLVTKLRWCYIYTQFAKSTKSVHTSIYGLSN